MATMHNPAHPGRVLSSYMEGRSVTDVASQHGIDPLTLLLVLHERASITPEISQKLSDAFNTSPDFWLRMQAQFDEWQESQLPEP